MPFSDYRQTIEIARAKGGDSGDAPGRVRRARGPLVLIDRFTVRGRLDRALRDSVRGRDAIRVGQPFPSWSPYALR